MHPSFAERCRDVAPAGERVSGCALSRRSLLWGTAAAVAGCASAPVTGPRVASAEDARSEPGAFLRALAARRRTRRLRVLLQDRPAARSLYRALREVFEPATGVAVHVVFRRGTGAGPAEGFDVVQLDALGVRANRERLLPLDAAPSSSLWPSDLLTTLPQDLAEHVGRPFGPWHALPFDAPTTVMAWRTDVLMSLEVPVPATPDDLAALPVAGGPRWRVVWSAAGDADLARLFVAGLWAHGGALLTRAGTGALDEEPASAALGWLARLRAGRPRTADGLDARAAAQALVGGQATLGLVRTDALARALAEVPAAVARTVRIAPLPTYGLRLAERAGGGEVPGSAPCRPTALAVLAATQEPELAWALAQWAVSDDVVVRRLADGGGLIPFRAAVLDDARIAGGVAGRLARDAAAIAGDTLGVWPHVPAAEGWAAGPARRALWSWADGRRNEAETLAELATGLERALTHGA